MDSLSKITGRTEAAEPLPPFAPRPAILEGRWARLEPLSTHHAAGLLPIGVDEETWRFTTHSPFRSPDDALQYIHAAQANALGTLRVQLKTDARNVRSQAAIERLGAVREGVLRHHMLLPDGHLRDTVMYSVLRPEWPSVRDRLERLMEGR